MNTYGEPRFPYIWEEIKKLFQSIDNIDIDKLTGTGDWDGDDYSPISDQEAEEIRRTLAQLQSQLANLSYNSLLNKPSMDGVVLQGNVRLNESGIHEALSNTEVEDLINSVV